MKITKAIILLTLILILSGCAGNVTTEQAVTATVPDKGEEQHSELMSLLSRAEDAFEAGDAETFEACVIEENEKYIKYREIRDMSDLQLEAAFQKNKEILIKSITRVENLYSAGEYVEAYAILKRIPARPTRTTPPADPITWSEPQRMYNDVRAKLEEELYTNPRTLKANWDSSLNREVVMKNIVVTKNKLNDNQFECKMIDQSDKGYDSDTIIIVDYNNVANAADCVALSASPRHKIEIEVRGIVGKIKKSPYHIIKASEIKIWD